MFYRNVLPHQFEFLAKRDFICTMKSERASQHLAQMFDYAHSAFTIVVANEHCDRV